MLSIPAAIMLAPELGVERLRCWRLPPRRSIVASREVLALCSVDEEGVRIESAPVPEEEIENEGVPTSRFEEELRLFSSASIEGRGMSASASTSPKSLVGLAIVLRSLPLWGVKTWENPDDVVVGEDMFAVEPYLASLAHILEFIVHVKLAYLVYSYYARNSEWTTLDYELEREIKRRLVN
jgi:hypothetical protein